MKAIILVEKELNDQLKISALRFQRVEVKI